MSHEVRLISFATEPIANQELDAVCKYCYQVDVVRYRSFKSNRVKALLGFFCWQPRSVIDTFSEEIDQLVKQAVDREGCEVVIASQIDMAPYATRLSKIKIFEEIELTTIYEQFAQQSQIFKKLRGGLTWWKLSHYTARLLQSFDAGTVVSEAERGRVLAVSPHFQSIVVIPNGVDTTYYRGNFGLPEVDTLIYSGALTYHANFDAVDYFLSQIFPLIQAKRPQVKLSITGKLDGVPIERLPKSRNGEINFTGYLNDIRPALAQSWINIVPLRVGGGTRLKILESLAIGTPVVTTGKGAEGLDLIPGHDLLVADTPTDFAMAVLHLLQDVALRESLSRNGRQTVEAKYDWQTIGQSFNDFIEKVVGGK